MTTSTAPPTKDHAPEPGPDEQHSLTAPVRVEEVVAALERLRVQLVGRETQIHAEIRRAFTGAGIPFEAEAELGPGARVDFLVRGGIAVEVKKGKPNAARLAKQAERYAAFNNVRALVLVVERNVQEYPRTANGKPVRYVALHKQWGISLGGT